MSDNQKSYLEMSDEELLNAPMPTETVSENLPADDETEAEDDVKQDVPAEDSPNPVNQDNEDEVPAESEEEPGTGSDDDEDGEDPKDTKPVEKEPTEQSVNYEQEYKRILAPFKANGKEVEVKSVDDAITLMQMGANYQKKMAALKPNLKILKILENNGLLDEGKLSFLIDLEKKNPDAINKLLSDSGLSPMDLDPDKAGEYKPNIHTVDDREIDLDRVLDEIQHTDSYTRTLGIVSKEWDGASKQTIADYPQLLAVINDHVSRGIYDVIAKEVERERMLGRLSGMSDIEAYRQVGDAIQAKGGFDHLGSSQTQRPAQQRVVPSKSKPNEDMLKDKKRAASSSKPGSSSGQAADFNPLSMSDDEFEKIAEPRYR